MSSEPRLTNTKYKSLKSKCKYYYSTVASELPQSLNRVKKSFYRYKRAIDSPSETIITAPYQDAAAENTIIVTIAKALK